MPRMETGTEIFEIDIPEGHRLSLVDLEISEASQLAGAEILRRPPPGSVGRQQIELRWSYPVPLGNLTFRLRAHASPTGTPPPIRVGIVEPGSDKRMRLLFEQDVPVDLAVSGSMAETFRDQIVERGGRIEPLAAPMFTGAEETAIILGISLAVIAAICVLVGLATFAAVLFFAMQKGYNIDDAGYKVAVGEGKSRQEHQMVFKIRQPGT
jgi:hypothetical protein